MTGLSSAVAAAQSRWTSSAVAAAQSRWTSSDQARSADHDYLCALGDEITNKLFRAGLDLCSALGLAKDESVRLRLEQAVGEIDDAVKDVRYLMLAAIAMSEGDGD